MVAPPNESRLTPHAARLRLASVAVGIGLVALGASMLAFWAVGLQHKWYPGGGPLMKANAAAGFVLGGVSLALVPLTGRSIAIQRALAAAVLLLATATLFEWITGIDLGFDQILFVDDTKAYTSVPGRIAPNTAFAFTLFGVSLLLARARGIALSVSRALAVAATLIGGVALAGYVFGVSPLFALAKQTGMALPAAVGLVLFGIGILLARPDAGTTALLASDGAGGALARKLLPILAAVPFAVSLPAEVGVRIGWLDQGYASALITVVLTALLVWFVAWSAKSMEHREQALRETTERLAAREVELSALNRELESFSYSVSHDLRSPLRSIDGFGLALVEDCAAALPPEGVAHVKRMRAATQRMGTLIDDLLHLSRTARAEMRHVEVDLSGMAREIAEELRRTAPERQVTFEIEDGLVARGDPGLLRQVLANLLGNSWKFTAKHPTARIAFGRRARDGVLAYQVTDDGAGFDMAYAKKLFGAFQRLHGQAEFAGTGIGLATVQRIVRRHGGDVWAEGAVERGATITFTLGERLPGGERQ